MRCFKGRFTDSGAARIGMRRCHGGSVNDGVLWQPCRYLPVCMGEMTLEQWKKKRKKGVR